MTVESGLSTGPTTSTYHVLCSSRGERTRCFSSVFKRLTLPQTLFVEKTKQLILNFKIRHVCFSKKLLKPTMPRSLKQGLRRPPTPPARQEPEGSTSRAGCTALRLLPGVDGESPEAVQTPSTVRGGSAQKPWAPRCHLNPFRCLPNGAKLRHSPLQPPNPCSISGFDQQGQTSVSSTKMGGKRQTQLLYSTSCSPGSVPVLEHL